MDSVGTELRKGKMREFGKVNRDDTGKVVRFLTNNGNEFREGDLAICMNSDSKLFMGLSGDNFLRMHYDGGKYEVLPTFKPDIEDLLISQRTLYHMYKNSQ